MSEQKIEKEIQDKGLNAPRLTPELIDGAIVSSDFHVFAGSQLTVCCLTLANGFNVSGESACASPENFDIEIGKKIAFGNARDKIWMLEGYLLKQKLHDEPSDFLGRLNVERESLFDKLSKISTFINSDAFGDLPNSQQVLMEEQSMSMCDYLEVLDKRLSLLND